MKAMYVFACAVALSVVLPDRADARRLSDDERLAIYLEHAGAPVDSISYVGHYDGWTSFDENYFALWTAPSRAYMIEVYGPCIGLDYASTIRFDNRVGRLSARFDRVYVGGSNINPIGCQIKGIRPLDVKAARAAEKDARAQPKPQKVRSGSAQPEGLSGT